MRIRLYHLPVVLPQAQAPRGPFINIMPIGLLALAERLQRDGHDAEVVHGGVEQRLAGKPDLPFDVPADIERDPVDLAGFSLQWHHQLGPVGDAIEAIRERHLRVPIVLGGLTASGFAEDILRSWAGVDYVLRGDAEEPLAALAQHLSGNLAIAAVQNLSYRVAGEVVHNPISYVAGQEEIDSLEFSRLDLLRHGEHYNSQFARTPEGWKHPPSFYLGVGRGCSVDCAFCSGGRSAQRELAGRTALLFRSPSRVVHDVEQLVAQGIRTVCVCFDPPSRSERYYLDLFRLIREAGLDVAMVFECYRPPSRDFLDSFARTFSRQGTRISYSPTVADETLRSRLLGVRYGNAAIEAALEHCVRLGIETTLYFATVPQESLEQLDRSLAWQKTLVQRFGCRLTHSPIEMEPRAPWSNDPGAYGMASVRQGFDAFQSRHRRLPTLGACYATEVGYAFPDVDARVIRLASFLLDPVEELTRALSTSGAGLEERILMAAPGKLQKVLALAAPWRSQPMTLFVPAQECGLDDWNWLGRIADALGPNVKVVPFAPDSSRHVPWDGRRRPERTHGTAVLLDLHDAAGALSLLRPDAPARGPLGPGMDLARACRWSATCCAAANVRMIAVAANDAVRACTACPPLSGDVADLARALQERAGQLARARGCGSCPAEASCSKCLFVGAIGDEAFCTIRRRTGPLRLSAGLPSGAPIAVGWDR